MNKCFIHTTTVCRTVLTTTLFMLILSSMVAQTGNNEFGYTTLPDTNSSNVSPVGSPQGSFNVSPLGGATYTVGIEAPQGLPGMQPSVALVYNSQAGNGIAGYGFNLSGVSVITRGPRTVYHDGKAGGITHDKDDAFYLDGQRLILREHTEGSDSSVYCLENDPFFRIVLHGLSWISQSYMWFSAQDKNGIRYEFGSVGQQSYSKSGSTKINAWYITRMENSVGNYATYSYLYNNYYLYPQTITYGSNSHIYTGLTNKIEFTYEERTNDPMPFSLEGVQGCIRYRLKTITSKTGSDVYRTYTLNYNTEIDSTNTKFSRLTSVSVANGNNESLKPITFSWQGLPSQSIQTQALSVSTTIPGGVVDHEKSYYSSGDLNGDGLTDIFEKGYGHPNIGDDYSFYRLHTAKRNSDGSIGFDIDTWYSYGDDLFFDEDLYSYYFTPSAFDIDGDGICEMGIPQQTRTPTENYIGFRFYGNNGYKTGFRYNKETTSNDKYCYGVGDFNNDGKSEVVIIENYQTSSYYVGAVMGAETLTNTFTRPFHFTLSYEPRDMYVADINLDGLADIIVIHQNGYTIYWNDGTWLDSHTSLCTPNCTSGSFSYSISPARAFPGDFNGDGITDFLVTVANSDTWYMELGKGDGTFTHKTACTINAYEQSGTYDDNRLGCYVYDMDGDGKSDVVICKGMYVAPGLPIFDKTYTYWMRSTGESLQQVKLSTSTREADAMLQYYMIGDFNGDGLPELANNDYDCYNGNNANESPAWHVYPNTTYSAAAGKLSSATNGFDATTTISYKSLTDNSVYTKNYQTETPDSAIVSCPPVLHVVASATSDDGAAGQQTVNYLYGGLKANLKGKGLLGMSYTKASNTTQGTAIASGVSKWNTESLQPERTYTRQFKGSDSLQTVTRFTSSKPYTQKSWFTHPDTIYQTDMDGNISRVVNEYDQQHGYLKHRYEYWDDYASFVHNYSAYACYRGIWLPTVIEDIRYSQVTDDLTTETHLEYNTYGQKTLETANYSSSKPLTRTYTYDGCGNLTSESVSGSGVNTNTKTYTYDSTKRFVLNTTETADNHSLVNSATYDTWGNVLTETTRTAGNNPQTTRHVYDNWGFRTRTILPTGQVSVFSRGWGNSGSRCYWQLERGTATPWVKTWYDRSGRKTYEESITVLDVGASHTWQYDNRGRLTAELSSVGYLVKTDSMTYDDRDRIHEHQYPDGRSMAYTYGNRTVTATDGAGRSYTKTYDPRGNLLTSSDPSGIVTYDNNSDGQPLTVTAHGATVTIDYDDRGNRNSLTDPDAGTMTYVYDALGRVISQTDARNNVTTFTYDGFGNLTATAINGQPHASYTYSYSGATAGLLTNESAGGATVNYTYDSYDRLSTKTYTLTGTLLNQSMQYSYTYGTNGLLQTVSYPGGLNVGYTYDCYGNKMQTTSDGTTVWQLYSYNGQNTIVQHSSVVSNRCKLTADGKLNQLAMLSNNATAYGLSFTFDTPTGNLISRSGMIATAETFAYDSLDRLTGAGNQIYSYADNGNLTYKTGIGHYMYNSTKPHAVTSIENTARLMKMSRLDTEYNAFGKISRIHDFETGRSMDFLYGPDDERYCSIQRYEDGSIEHEIIYLDGIDLRIDWDGVKKWTYYPDDHVITRRVDNGAFNHYFTFTDQVGSILKVVDANGIEKFSATYDPWGRQTVTLNQIGFIRGYTGHEMLTEYGLINMNGRLYDPLLGRFLSTDNFVQEPGSTQSFNRYSYCLNNPLKYNDPDGELWWLAIGAAIGGLGNLAIKAYNGEIHGWKDGFVAFGIGAAAGAVGTVAAGAAIAALGTTAGSFGGAFLVGALSAAYSLPTQNLANHMFFGDPMMTGWEYANGVLFAGLSSGIITGISNELGGRNFFSGKMKMPKANVSIDIMPIASDEISIAPVSNIKNIQNIELGNVTEHTYELDSNFKIIKPILPDSKGIITNRPAIKGYANRAWPTDKNHTFPRTMDKKIVEEGLLLYHKGNTGFIYPGTVDGKMGFYNITMDRNNIIKHRMFYPYKRRNSIWVGTTDDKLYFFK